jgi:hypothetical protein
VTWGLLKTFGPYVAIVVLGWLCLGQHDQLVTWRLKDKDQQAIAYNLRQDIQDRDKIIRATASAEAGDRGDADKSCAADISSSFQKGVAVGRAITHASKPSPPGQQPAAGVMRDYRQAWSAGAYTPRP